MKRIVIDARESGTSTGRYVDKLVEYMHKLEPEYEVILLTKTPRVEYLKSVAPGFRVIESNYKEFTFAEQIGLLRQINRLEADLVHFAVAQQPVLYRGKAVTTIHDLTTARFNNQTKNWLVYKFKQLVYKWVIGRVAKKSEALITPSDYVKYDVAQFSGVAPEKITVTHEAADLITEPPETVSGLGNTDFIMYVGRPQPHKNLKRLVRAFSTVQLTHPKLKLALVGKLDDNYLLLKKYARRRDIKGIVFTDFVTEGQLRWLYENARAYVFPSLSEGFGLPGLEALVHGLPLVSSRATCLPEIYKDGAIYFDPRSTNEMTEKIKLVLEDKTLAAQLRQKGPELAAKYSWQRMAEQTLTLYDEVLEGR
ncbi:MAG: glycosyltransferase family 1 protein [Patescibacteria group bacterium]